MSRKLAGLVLGALSLTGCASIHMVDMTAQSRIEPTPSGFAFWTRANASWPEGSEHYESLRLQVMRQFATANGLCPGGYSVRDRQVIRRPAGLLGIDAERDITYRAHCVTG